MKKVYKFTSKNGAIEIIMAKSRYEAWSTALKLFGVGNISRVVVSNNVM